MISKATARMFVSIHVQLARRSTRQGPASVALLIASKAVFATATVSGPDQLLVKGKGFTERLILWGRGDLDQDGREDLLVQTLDTLTEGTYRNTRLFVLTRKSPTAPLSVVKQLL